MTAPTRPDLLQAEYDAACERIGDLLEEVEKAEAERDRLAAKVGEKDAALQAALPYLWTHADMMPTVSAQDCTMQVAKEVEKALDRLDDKQKGTENG